MVMMMMTIGYRGVTTILSLGGGVPEAFAVMCTKDENNQLTDTKTYKFNVRCHARCVATGLGMRQEPTNNKPPMFWKRKHAQKRPVATM